MSVHDHPEFQSHLREHVTTLEAVGRRLMMLEIIVKQLADLESTDDKTQTTVRIDGIRFDDDGQILQLDAHVEKWRVPRSGVMYERLSGYPLLFGSI